jgi:hypothetical protein
MEHLSEYSRPHDYYYDLELEAKRNWLDGDLQFPNRHHAKEALTCQATLTSADQYHKELEALRTKQRARSNLHAYKEEYKASRSQTLATA